jgi:hypothetical protein
MDRTTQTEPMSYVLVLNPGQDDESIGGEFETLAAACRSQKRDFADDATDVMKRLADVSLTTEF